MSVKTQHIAGTVYPVVRDVSAIIVPSDLRAVRHAPAYSGKPHTIMCLHFAASRPTFNTALKCYLGAVSACSLALVIEA